MMMITRCCLQAGSNRLGVATHDMDEAGMTASAEDVFTSSGVVSYHFGPWLGRGPR